MGLPRLRSLSGRHAAGPLDMERVADLHTQMKIARDGPFMRPRR